MQKATFSGGCFWCTEALFIRLIGVESVFPGYSGGHVKNPTYEDVCDGNTGHAESIQILFDENKISYAELLEIFFFTHDPTTENRQGNDVGAQYRSIIFYHDEDQKNKATQMIKKLENKKIYKNKIVTDVLKFKNFYIAEDYHKKYYDKNKNAPYCNATILPKINKLMDKYSLKIKNDFK